MDIHVSQLYRLPSGIKKIIQRGGSICNPERVLVIIGEYKGYLYCTDDALSCLQIKSQDVCISSQLKLLMCCDVVIKDGLILKNRYGKTDI